MKIFLLISLLATAAFAEERSRDDRHGLSWRISKAWKPAARVSLRHWNWGRQEPRDVRTCFRLVRKPSLAEIWCISHRKLVPRPIPQVDRGILPGEAERGFSPPPDPRGRLRFNFEIFVARRLLDRTSLQSPPLRLGFEQFSRQGSNPVAGRRETWTLVRVPGARRDFTFLVRHAPDEEDARQVAREIEDFFSSLRFDL